MPNQPNFIPKRREISGVTNAIEAEVTTTEEHGYELGHWVTLNVSKRYGMELDFVLGKILNIPSMTTFILNVDTSSQLPYITPSEPPSFTQSHVVPVSGLFKNNTSITG
jgi:hypothetical protein